MKNVFTSNVFLVRTLIRKSTKVCLQAHNLESGNQAVFLRGILAFEKLLQLKVLKVGIKNSKGKFT